MNEKLPIWIIEGTEFIVDVKQNELRQRNNVENTISFDDMEYKGTHYTTIYDTQVKNKPSAFQGANKNCIEIVVPQKVDLDRESMAEKYGINSKQLANKTDFEIIVDQDKYTSRIDGCLPSISIAGSEYFIDLRLKELRAADNLLNRIDLRMLDTDDNGNFLFFFRPKSGTLVEIKSDITALPKDIVMIEMPNELKLDPYSVAREYGLEVKNWLMKFPIQNKLEAKAIPISKTGLPDLVRKNKQELLRKDSDNTNTNKRSRHL